MWLTQHQSPKQPKHELLCSKFTLCDLTGKTAGNHGQPSFVRFLVTSRVSACLSHIYDIYFIYIKYFQLCPFLQMESWLAEKQQTNRWSPTSWPYRGPQNADGFVPSERKPLSKPEPTCSIFLKIGGSTERRSNSEMLSGDLQANHSCYIQLIFPSYLLPTTNSQRQEIEKWERKRDIVSLENRTKDRALIVETWKTSLTCSTSNLRWILNIQFKLTYSEIKINTSLFWFLYMLNLLL